MRQNQLDRIEQRLENVEKGVSELRSATYMTMFVAAVLFALIVGVIVKVFFG